MLQSEDQNDLFDVMFFNSNGRPIEHGRMSTEELHLIEDILIRSQDVIFEEMLVEMIDKK